MAIWDRPRHARVELRENVYVDAYGESAVSTENALRSYAGDTRVDEWRKARKLEVEPYAGEKRGVEINFERDVRRGQEESLDVPRALRVEWNDGRRAPMGRQPARDERDYAQPSPVLVHQDPATGRKVFAESRELAQAITVEPLPGTKGGLHIKINLAELEAPNGRRSPKMEEDFRSTVNTVLARVDVLERGLDARDQRVAAEGPRDGSAHVIAASSERRIAVEQLAERELPGVMSAARETVVARAVRAELETRPIERPGAEAEERARVASGSGLYGDELRQAERGERSATAYYKGARDLMTSVERDAPGVVRAWKEFEEREPDQARRMVEEKSGALHAELARSTSEPGERRVEDALRAPDLAMLGRPYSLEHVAVAAALKDKGDQLAEGAASLRQRAGEEPRPPGNAVYRKEWDAYLGKGEPGAAEQGARHAAERQEFRGTITEAIKVAEERHGVKAFASADWQDHGRLRAETPEELTGTIERVRGLIAPEAKDERVYTVRENGTIHNMITGRDEYVPVPPEAVRQRGDGGPRLAKDGPREGAPPGARAEAEHEHSEPEVSVSMS